MGRGEVGRPEVGLERGWREMYVARGDRVFCDGVGRAVKEGVFGVLSDNLEWPLCKS